MTKDVLEEAVHVAAMVMTEAGMCIHENPAMCKNFRLSDEACDKCIETWLIEKAKMRV